MLKPGQNPGQKPGQKPGKQSGQKHCQQAQNLSLAPGAEIWIFVCAFL